MTETTEKSVRTSVYNLTTPPAIVLPTDDLTAAAMLEAQSNYIRRLSGAVLWSSSRAVPEVGEFVRVCSFGLCSVAGYFIEHSFLGLRIEPIDPPGWWVRQRARDDIHDAYPPEPGLPIYLTCAFGVDLHSLSPEDRRAIAELHDTMAREAGCFSSFWDLLNTDPGYRPTIHPDCARNRMLRRAYDLHQRARGDERRVFPHDSIDGTGR